MKVTEISVTYGGKINIGNYNSLHIEMTANAQLDEGESVEDASRQLFQVVKEQIRAEGREAMKRRGGSIEDTFAGTPINTSSTN